MNQAVMKKWTERLRSGDYAQGQSALRQQWVSSGTEMFCCLGVLCEIAVEEGVIPPSTMNGVGTHTYGLGSDVSSVYLPLAVQKWSGISTRDGVYNGSYSLVTANDSGVDFDEIADIIERHFGERS